jgi:hypothetical protein
LKIESEINTFPSVLTKTEIRTELLEEIKLAVVPAEEPENEFNNPSCPYDKICFFKFWGK